jgi:glucose-6-phosphate-specific signal transduction histidine kinase
VSQNHAADIRLSEQPSTFGREPEEERSARPLSQESFIEAMETLQQGLAELLHDTSSQSINAARIYARVARNALQSSCPDASPILAPLEQAIEKAAEELHDLSRWLRPSRVDSSGLVGNLRELAALAARRAPCVFRCRLSVIHASFKRQAALLRIAQLALLSTVRQRCPSALELRVEKRALLMEIQMDSAAPLPEQIELLLDACARAVGGTFAQRTTELGALLTCRVPTR